MTLPDSWRPTLVLTPEVRQDSPLPIYDERQLLRGEWTPDGPLLFGVPRHAAFFIAILGAIVFAIGSTYPTRETSILGERGGYEFDPVFPWSQACDALRAYAKWRRTRSPEDRECALTKLERIQSAWINARGTDADFPPDLIEPAWLEVATEDWREAPVTGGSNGKIDTLRFPVNPGDTVAQVVSILGAPDERDTSSAMTYRERGVLLGIVDQRVTAVTYVTHGRRLVGYGGGCRSGNLVPIDPCWTRRDIVAIFGWASYYKSPDGMTLSNRLIYPGAIDTEFIFECRGSRSLRVSA